MFSVINRQNVSAATRSVFSWFLLVIGWFLLAASLWQPAKAADTKQKEAPYQITTAIHPLSGYSIGEPFSLQTAISCPEANCPIDIVIELSDGISFVQATSQNGSAVSYDISTQTVELTSPASQQTNNAFQLLLVIDEPIATPSIRIGESDSDTVTWHHDVNLLAAPPTLEIQNTAAEQSLYLQSRFLDRGFDLKYTIAAANRSDEAIENLTLTTRFPAGVQPVGLTLGSFTEPSAQPSISYLVTTTWTTLEIGQPITQTKNSQQEADPLTYQLPISDPPIKAIRYEFGDVPAGFRWAGSQSSQPTIQLTIGPELDAEWIELCTIASTNSADENQESCDTTRAIAQTQPPINVFLWSELRSEEALQPGEKIQILPRVELSAAVLTQTRPLDFVVELPRWLDFTGVIPQVVTPTQTVIFDQSTSLSSGHTRLHWQWPEPQLISLTLPIIEAKAQAGIPSGNESFPIYLLTNGPQTCWGERPTGRDLQHLDGDDDLNEFVCQTKAEVGVQPFAGFGADLRIIGNPAPGIPFSAEFDIINEGNLPLNRIDTVVRLPEKWLTVPPEVPAGIALSYSTALADELCDGEANCPSADWQDQTLSSFNQVTAVKLTGTLAQPLNAGDRATIRFHLQPSPDFETIRPTATQTETITTTQPAPEIIWPPIVLNGTTTSGDEVGFRFEPESIQLTETPAVTEDQAWGQTWLDGNQNGRLDNSEPSLANIPVALISPAGDGEPGTIDDRIIGWSRSEEDGTYRFAEPLGGSYYLAVPQTRVSLFPTELLDSTGITTAFNPQTWRTEPFTVFQGESIEQKNLALGTPDRPTLSGVVAVDENQNSLWDDPVSAGINGVLVSLVGPDDEVLAETVSRIDGFGQPGRFVLPQPNGFLPSNRILRLTSSAPFVDGVQTETGDFQIEFEVIDQADLAHFPVLVESPPQGIDSGDAPPSYGIALHPITPETTLGLISDGDQIGAGIQDDDNDSLDDEEGIFFADGGRGTTADDSSSVVVVMRNQEGDEQRLNGWIDFDGDGRFSESERIIEGYRPFPQKNPQAKRFSYTIPPESACGTTFARFRLGSVNSDPDGEDESGEVEDIPYQIDCVTDLAVNLEPQITPMGPNEISHWFLTVHNRGSSLAENVRFNVTIPTPVNYQGVVSLTNDPLACSDNETARLQEALECQIGELTPGQGITLSLAFLLPFDTDARSVGSVATVSAVAPLYELRRQKTTGVGQRGRSKTWNGLLYRRWGQCRGGITVMARTSPAVPR